MCNDQDQFFDLERDILAPNRTPLLKATKPNFDIVDSPPAVVSYDPSSYYTDTEEANSSGSMRGRRVRGSQTLALLADGVLIRHIEP